MPQTDGELLTEYQENRSEAAFEELVRRYAPLVYGAALRYVRRPQAAEDVTQAVFLVLSQKAASLNGRSVLGGWLLTVTRYAAIDVMRKENLQRRHEQAAAAERPETTMTAAESAAQEWEVLGPAVDEALARLGAADRDALVLRYFQDLPLAEVGRQLRISEEAARKRVTRALARLREMISGRGVTASAALLAAAIPAHATAAPPGALMASLVAIPGGAMAGTLGVSHTVAKGAIKMMALAKAKILAGVWAAVLVLGGAGFEAGRVLLAAPSPEPAVKQAADGGGAAPATTLPAPTTKVADWSNRLAGQWQSATVSVTRNNPKVEFAPTEVLSRSMQIVVLLRLTDISGIIGADSGVVVTRMVDDTGRDVTDLVQRSANNDRWYRPLGYTPTFDQKTKVLRHELSPLQGTISLQPTASLGRIARIEGYIRCLAAEQMEHVDVPYVAGGKPTAIAPGLSISFRQADFSKGSYTYAEAPETGGAGRYQFNGLVSQERKLPPKIVVEQFFVDSSGNRLIDRRDQGAFPSGGGMGSGSDGALRGKHVSAMRYEVAVNPREQNLPFVLSDIELPDATSK